MESINFSSQQQIHQFQEQERRQKIQKAITDYQARTVHEFIGKQQDFFTIISLKKDGKIMASDGKTIYLLTKKLKVIKHYLINMPTYNGVQSGRKLFCQVGFNFKVLDPKRNYQIKSFSPKDEVQVIKKIDDHHLIFGETNGIIQIVSVAENKITNSYNLDYSAQRHRRRASFLPSIFDIAKTSCPNEYALATKRGVLFCKINTELGDQDIFSQNKEEEYLKRLEVRNLIQLEPNIFLATLANKSSIFKINRTTQKSDAFNPQTNLYYNQEYVSLKKVIGYNPITFPFVLMRDQFSYQLIETTNMAVVRNFKIYDYQPFKVMIQPPASLKKQMLILRKGSKLSLVGVSKLAYRNEMIIQESVIYEFEKE
ncbi:UNKNOWN [Stylonychia lemnae]|uniref:Uncharacterized protein n=1 Tax=Stylonychia lemnae TaxID=5949 RepID=A0A078A1R6_STYLE|nr:UNKNOWN [Stylonychia lemnae]|eukprot:CDW75408.1 UNKNOWN [Stylonychia lemnae]